MSKKKVFGFLKKVVTEVAVEATLETVRGYLQVRLEPLTPDMLYEAVVNGTHSWDVASEKDKKRAHKWARKIPERLRKRFTADLYFQWLREDFPDLASLLMNMHGDGMAWVQKDVEKVRAHLFPD